MKWAKYILYVAVLIGVLLFGFLVPVTDEIEKYSLDSLPKEYISLQKDVGKKSAELEQDTSQYCISDTAYLLTTETLFGQTNSIVYVPYICCQIADVGTSGTADWMLSYGMIYPTGKESASAEIKKLTSKLTVEADENTCIYLDSSLPSDELQHRLVISEKQMNFEENSSANVILSAATIDSSEQRNKNCVVSVEWSTDIVGMGLFSFPKERMKIQLKDTYRGNV